jgi:hypothetical protein
MFEGALCDEAHFRQPGYNPIAAPSSLPVAYEPDTPMSPLYCTPVASLASNASTSGQPSPRPNNCFHKDASLRASFLLAAPKPQLCHPLQLAARSPRPLHPHSPRPLFFQREQALAPCRSAGTRP